MFRPYNCQREFSSSFFELELNFHNYEFTSPNARHLAVHHKSRTIHVELHALSISKGVRESNGSQAYAARDMRQRMWTPQLHGQFCGIFTNFCLCIYTTTLLKQTGRICLDVRMSWTRRITMSQITVYV
jgi:hypothetical protein